MRPLIKNINNASSVLSILLHTVLLLIFFLISAYQPEQENLIEISYGEPGGGSGGYGQMSNPKDMVENNSVEEKEADEKANENIPDVSNAKSDEKIKVTEAKPTLEKKISAINGGAKPAGNNSDGKGIGNGTGTGFGTGNGNGNGLGDGLGDGFGIDWGGAVRKIYNYNIPQYPEGVTKEIDVKLRFTILPDGTINNIIVLRKADATLERTAIEALKYWRFEPLAKNMKQIAQSAIITFPFRLD